MTTIQVNAHDVKAGDVIWNQGYAFEVAETFFYQDARDVEVFRYRVSRCVSDPKPPATYCKDAVYGHNASIPVTVERGKA